MLIARDRSEAFLLRLYSSPLRAGDFLTGYTLPLLPLCVGQGICCFAAAFALGLRCSVGNFLLCLAVLLPAAVLFIGIGLLCGSCMIDKLTGFAKTALDGAFDDTAFLCALADSLARRRK